MATPEYPRPFSLSHLPEDNEAANKTLKMWYEAEKEQGSREYLPQGISTQLWANILQRFQGIVGVEGVILGAELKLSYMDPFALDADEKEKRGSACALRPTTVEQIQAIVRLANEYRIPLWTVSRGKNLGYGGPAARVKV